MTGFDGDERPSHLPADAGERLSWLAASLRDRAEHGEDAYQLAAEFAGKLSAVRPAVLGDDGFPTLAIGAIPDPGPVSWLVQDLWTEQACGIVGGEPKSYKSFLSVHMAVCIAAGVRVLGHHETRKGRVLMFNAEDRPGSTRRRVERMCAALDVDPRALDLLLIDTPALRLDEPAALARLRATVAREKPALLYLDPLRDLHMQDENDAGRVAAILAPLRILQREHGCSVLVVHHMAKVSKDGGARREGQRLRGSGALHGWVDSALYLTRGANQTSVTVEHREAPAPERFAFTVREHGMPGHEQIRLERTSVVAAGASEAEGRADKLKLKILEVLKSRPLKSKELREAVAGRASEIDVSRKALFLDTKIRQDDAGRWVLA